MLLLTKNYSSLRSTSDRLYELSDDDIRRMHKILLEMYKDLKKVCDKYGIRPIAGGGTALGAVRHQGFIPWDDDMDFGIYQE